MKPLNQFQFSGRAGGDGQVGGTGDRRYARVSVAVNQGKDKDAAWISVTGFRWSADVIAAVKKGDVVTVSGPLEVQVKDGKTFLNVIADGVVACDPASLRRGEREGGEGSGGAAASPSPRSYTPPASKQPDVSLDDADIPF